MQMSKTILTKIQLSTFSEYTHTCSIDCYADG